MSMRYSVYDKLNLLEDEIDGQEEIDVSGHHLRDSMEEIVRMDDEVRAILEELDDIRAKNENDELKFEEVKHFIDNSLPDIFRTLEKLSERLY